VTPTVTASATTAMPVPIDMRKVMVVTQNLRRLVVLARSWMARQ
jgi:hypothetical protein